MTSLYCVIYLKKTLRITSQKTIENLSNKYYYYWLYTRN